MTRQTISDCADVEPMKLYPGAGTSEQDSGIAKVMSPAYLGQHHQLRLATSNPSSVDVGADLVCVLSWNCLTGSWIQSP